MRSQYEKLQAQCSILETLGVNFYYGYQRTIRILTIAPRDCYLYILQHTEKDGTICSIIYDDPDDEKPTESGIVRCNALGFMKCTPLKDNPNKCSVDYMININFKGVIPTYAITVALNMSA